MRRRTYIWANGYELGQSQYKNDIIRADIRGAAFLVKTGVIFEIARLAFTGVEDGLKAFFAYREQLRVAKNALGQFLAIKDIST
jgi:hypothetical protein